MTTYQIPLGVTGDPGLLRISPSMLRQETDACATGLALRARPLLQQHPPRPRRKPIQDFWFTPVEQLLDAVEHDGADLTSTAATETHWHRKPPTHPGHRAWAEDAAESYLRARTRTEAERAAAGLPATHPSTETWAVLDPLETPDARGITQYERTIWGRPYSSADGTERELWIPFTRHPRTDRPRAELAAAAYVTAMGVPVRSAFLESSRPIRTPAPPNPVRHIRVIGVGLADGATEVLADCDTETAIRQFAAHTKPVMAQVADSTGLHPGNDCGRCEAVPRCSAVTHVPALLGVSATPAEPRKRRSVSVSDLRAHATCPASYHLTRVLHLGEGRKENLPIRRGRAVDAWLNERHADATRTPCRRTLLPESIPGLAPDEQQPALDMLRQHRALCPLQDLPDTERVVPQHRLTVYDPTADTLIYADIDLLHTDNGGIVLRETKTSGRRFGERAPLQRQYPQLALSVALLADGALGGDPRRNRVEFEVLRPDGATCQQLDPADPATVEQARQVISELAAGWAADRTYPAAPARGTRDCADCEVRRWCAVGRGDAAPAVRTETR